ncbi:hypothetical protein K440DRAFT_646678 [Wilcoxina mikolae CBS 423.85]|nr:hypothetical protein K440DRAFT_646678 [Wilcoxina mikolae CBS 423.85]
MSLGAINTCTVTVPSTIRAQGKTFEVRSSLGWQLVIDTPLPKGFDGVGGNFSSGPELDRNHPKAVMLGEFTTGSMVFRGTSDGDGDLITDIRYSLCVIKTTSTATNIIAENAFNITEPAPYANSDGTLNTTAIQLQLGSDFNKSKRERECGILQLLSGRNSSDEELHFSLNWCTITTAANVIFSDTSRGACFSRENKLDPTVAAIFNNTLRDTGRLSLAMEAVSSVLHSTTYYRNLVSIHPADRAVMRFSIVQAIPRRWTGFVVMLSLLAAHFLLLTAIVVVFSHSESFDQPLGWPTKCGTRSAGISVERCWTPIVGDTEARLLEDEVEMQGIGYVSVRRGKLLRRKLTWLEIEQCNVGSKGGLKSGVTSGAGIKFGHGLRPRVHSGAPRCPGEYYPRWHSVRGLGIDDICGLVET